eukprot:NP_508456.2 Uncharacterized protein CELE_K02E10.7 [Caenorhabditis elegans]
MKMECMFLSNQELDIPMELQKCCMSIDHASESVIERPVELTCLSNVVNGTGISDKIASGRFGTVFLGTITDSMLQVAIKEYHETFHDAVLTAHDEGSTLQKIISIEHPAIVQTFSVSHFQDIVYKVMEFHSWTLHDDILDKGKYDESQTKLVLVQATRALEYLHAQNLCHGTLHTKNIFLQENMVKISDIESSQFLNWLPFSQTPLHILPFIAPELHNQLSEVTSECDLWVKTTLIVLKGPNIKVTLLKKLGNYIFGSQPKKKFYNIQLYISLNCSCKDILDFLKSSKSAPCQNFDWKFLRNLKNSLGVCIFVMATGSCPFILESRNTMMESIQAGILGSPVLASDKIQSLVEQLIHVNPSERMSLKSLIEDDWMTSDLVWNYFISCHEDLIRELPVVDRFIPAESLEKSTVQRDGSEISIETLDEGYKSVASDHPEEPAVSGEQQVLTEPVPKKYHKKFAVFAMENVRKEWDNDITRIEKCKLRDGSMCLRIVIPAKDEIASSSIFNRIIKSRLGQTIKRFRSHQDTVVDSDFGDYALMNFRRENTEIEVARNMPKFTNKQQVQLYYCKKEAERVWENLAIKICMRCRRAGTDALNHDEDKCLYKLIAEAVESEEVIYYGAEDQFNLRFFSLVYRNDGGRASAMTRFRRGSIRVLTSGYRRIVKRFRRQSTSGSGSSGLGSDN